MSAPPGPLDPTDLHRIRAAEGWLELGLAEEALTELAYLKVNLGEHRLIYFLLDQLDQHLKLEAWDEVYAVAETLVCIGPDELDGWVHRAYAARRKPNGSLQAAWDALHPAAEKFPDELIIPYNLACYACQLGRLDSAREWLGRALTLAIKQAIGHQFRLMALADRDLTPLHEEIRTW